MSAKVGRTTVGELRPSQLLYTFGVGSVVDLPHLSVMVMGLEDWNRAYARPIPEERLLKRIRQLLGPQVKQLRAPPINPEETEGLTTAFDDANAVGVPVEPFPRWLRCPACNLLGKVDSALFQLRTRYNRPDQTKFVHASCNRAKEPTAVPARFLLACPRGHLDDFPWHWFAHRGPSDCRGTLRLYERGISGEAGDVSVKCEECERKMSMAQAFGEKARIPACRGRRPHLRDFDEEECGDEGARTVLLGASNSWFAITLSTLSIPSPAETELARRVAENWARLADADDPAIVPYLLKQGQLRGLEAWDPEEIWEAIRSRREAAEDLEEEEDLKVPEWQVLASPDPRRNQEDFRVREADPPKGWQEWIERVVLVERLREVTAQIGFTRIGSPRDLADSWDIPSRIRAPISRKDPTFTPAAEVRGEGIFLKFREDRLEEWAGAHTKEEREFFRAHVAWRKRRQIENPEALFPGIRYVFLHSFSHMLMRQLSLSCGYSAASIRERIYCRDPEAGEPMAGILLYTAAPDSEGTLGGLVALGAPDRLRSLLDDARRAIQLCSSDPLCAEHRPDPDGATLHAAACHACLFAPETSCETGNRFLDRSGLVS